MCVCVPRCRQSYWDIAKREVELRRQSHRLATLSDAFKRIQVCSTDCPMLAVDVHPLIP